jgi:hypothetical protein
MNKFCVKWFYLMREVHIRCFFLPLKFMKKHIWVWVDFFVSGWFWSLRQLFWVFFKTIDKFITVSKVFSVRNGFKNEFLGQNNLSPDFSTTIMVGIWANQTMCCLKFRADNKKQLKAQSCRPTRVSYFEWRVRSNDQGYQR